MERNMSLIRWILEHLEQKTTLAPAPVPACNKFTPEQISYHIKLCDQAGYFDDVDVVSGSEERFPRYEVGSLTWMGQETLKSLRS